MRSSPCASHRRARWEADIDRVLAGEELASPLHKAMSGTLISIAITGDDLLEKWKSRACARIPIRSRGRW